MLQTRNGKRTASAALKIAVDLVNEGMISIDEALLKIEPKQLDSLLHPTFNAAEVKKAKPVAKGLPASPGAACGKIAFSAEEAVARAKYGEKVVLVRLETSPEDIEGMAVARGMGACCVAGCGALKFDEENGVLYIDGNKYTREDYLSFDGSTGNIYAGQLKTEEPNVEGDFKTIMDWADKYRVLKIRTNADTPKDAKQAVQFGAEGIGLCRTEHMFFAEDRIPAIREMIIASNEEARIKALSKLLPMQKQDFMGLYEAMGDRPVTIRFLDPPLHEFLPQKKEDIESLAIDMNITYSDLKNKVDSLHEVNPMLGHRGCRLSVTYPEIAVMQTTAVIEAAIELNKKGYNIKPEIMIPLICEIEELKYVKKIIVDTAESVMAKNNVRVDYKVGTMIEIPRAALTAEDIAKEAEFFSFGTNDLSQMTFGFSRDDAAKFLDSYYVKKVFESDPFTKLDTVGVGKLMKIAIEGGKATRPDIKLGICGEQGGDPSTIEFCHDIGLNYVSCSPFRVPAARLAAAQANIKNPRK